MAPVKPRLRKREIAFALGAGAVATVGALAMMSEIHASDEARPALVAMEDSRTYQLAPFEEIASTGPQDVVVTVGGAQSVRVEGAPQAIAQLELVVEDGRLEIRPGEGFRGNWSSLGGATFHVTVPRLEDVAVAGSGDVIVDRIEGESFTAAIAGSGDLKVDRLYVGTADFSIAGPGSIVAAGNVTESRVAILGSGEVQGRDLETRRANVTIGGSGDVGLTVRERARISIGGSGDVAILGDAVCSVSKMGSGDVTCDGREIDD